MGSCWLRSPVPVPVSGLVGSSGLKMMSVPESTSGMPSPLKSATFMTPEESVFLRVSEPPSGVFFGSGVRPPKSSLIQVVIVPSSLVKMTSRSPSSSTSTVVTDVEPVSCGVPLGWGRSSLVIGGSAVPSPGVAGSSRR